MREGLRTVFAKRPEPYAGVDMANASRFGGAVWFLGALLSAILLPFVPPTEPIGGAGWAVAAAVIVGALISGRRMRRAGTHVNVDELLLYSYLAISAIAILVWLSGGVNSPYGQLAILSAIYTCAVHPPRRLVPYLALFTILTLLPLVYDDRYSRRSAVNLVVELVVWLGLSFVVLFLMHNVRAQRLGLRREGEQARQQARVDPLTGLLNRRAFDEDLARAIERTLSGGEPLSVLVADLDDFKEFNDRYGHVEGDRVLKTVGEALRGAVRRPDVAYRWGGDEFAVILPQADLDGAGQVADRCERRIRAKTGPDGDPLGIATGVAEFDVSDHDGAVSLLRAADEALLRAKGSEAFELPG